MIDLEQDVVNTQEEDTVDKDRARKTIENLHSKIDEMECTLTGLECNLEKKRNEIITFEK